MKIDNSVFDPNIQKEQPFAKANYGASFAEVAKAKVDAFDKAQKVGQSGYDKEEVTGKSAIEELQQKMENESMSAGERKNQMAVLSNTLSPEDYRKLQEEGFSIHETDGKTIVTVTDKIKAQLAKAGVDVSAMGDSLTREQLEAIGGSVAAANQLEREFAQADLPDSQENMAEGLEALNQAKELTKPSDGAIKYMLDNRLAPSIANLFLAEFSGSAGYTPPEDGEIDFDSLTERIEQVITQAGEKVNDQTIEDSKWMIKSQIPFTAENFSYVEKLRGLELPMEESQVISAVALAVSEGGRPEDAMLLPEYTLKAQAEHAMEVVMEASDEDLAYLTANNMEITIESLEQTAELRKQGKLNQTNSSPVLAEAKGAAEGEEISHEALMFLKAKRVLEETRLAMTTEANRALLKQGISIDTKPLEELVESLKQQENNYYEALLGEKTGVNHTESMTQLFAETAQKVSDLKQMPAYLLGIQGRDLDTVNGLHEAGTVLKDTLDKANESYETLMTAPRADLGDSIKKAFANVDDILKDLGLEANDANERAVRILAYNSLEINEGSILAMKAADERVQRTFANLTPATVREMIHQGINPLDTDLDTLNKQAEAIRLESPEADNERFSEYLWKLEHNNEISPEERESYIGIYRLMNQVEKTDGAAIGALIAQGGELTMRNLLTAVRSSKKSGMDYTVDDEFSGVDGTVGKSITDQIETAYQSDCMRDVLETLTPVKMQKLMESPGWEDYTPEQLKQALMQMSQETEAEEAKADQEYYKAQAQEVRQAAVTEEQVYSLLSKLDLPNTVDNVLAANRLMNKRNQVFNQLFNKDEVFSGEEVDFQGIKEEILERFANAMKTPKEMAAAQEVLAETAENVMKTMIADKEHITSMDIRELKLMNAQLSIAGKMAEEENYTIPVLVGNEVTNMSLKIVRGTKKKGIVEIMFETEKAGRIAANIRAEEKGISGFVAADRKETRDRIEAHAESITGRWPVEGENILKAAYVDELDFNRFSHSAMGEVPEKDSESYEIQTARLYEIAKSFMESIKELEF
ncbi:DUF6240 domain-containing protein [Roseburia sp. 1XD42-69]|uniref:DUF6240 domain-containing protein n=1 Tax=Roseburia sp. 1XD42-69 TaxID=2320088 RepID=UPI000EA1C9B4|nr:DUF6240 domain-containing protein [Roseburia sp. 1XD42-69]RKJ67115.1 hypothetical protein D7Y06_06005 [Roseburia sp. 1XD42-69]